MKISLALLVLLLAAAWTGSQGFFHSSRSICCSEFHNRKILESKIEDYQETPSSCNLKAVLLRVPWGWVCVNPQKNWVQKYLKKQKKSNSTST